MINVPILDRYGVVVSRTQSFPQNFDCDRINKDFQFLGDPQIRERKPMNWIKIIGRSKIGARLVESHKPMLKDGKRTHTKWIMPIYDLRWLSLWITISVWYKKIHHSIFSVILVDMLQKTEAACSLTSFRIFPTGRICDPGVGHRWWPGSQTQLPIPGVPAREAPWGNFLSQSSKLHLLSYNWIVYNTRVATGTP